jgi:hypothetical protein
MVPCHREQKYYQRRPGSLHDHSGEPLRVGTCWTSDVFEIGSEPSLSRLRYRKRPCSGVSGNDGTGALKGTNDRPKETCSVQHPEASYVYRTKLAT